MPGLLQKAYPNIRVLNVTAGADGSYSFYGDADPIFVPACTLGGVIETTGAGDTFCASVLDYALTHGLENLTPRKPPGNAALCQHRRLHRHHPEGRHPCHASGGRGSGTAVTKGPLSVKHPWQLQVNMGFLFVLGVPFTIRDFVSMRNLFISLRGQAHRLTPQSVDKC